MDLVVNAVAISRDPIVVVVANNPQDRYLGDARKIAEHYSLDDFHIFVSPQFSIWKKSHSDKLDRLQAIRDFQRDYPRSQVTYLCNEALELEVFTESDINALHVNQNAFIDEDIFYPSTIRKKYDAIYVGQLQEFKRHFLAKYITSLAFVYYGGNAQYLKSIVRDFPDAEFLNGIPEELGGNGKRSLKAWEMATAYNQSSVGLCLSEVEGAMYASTEYLLCGLPVVTTHNVGGRNDFFDEYNSISVDADASMISDAVQHFVANSPDPILIRQKTIERMNTHRLEFSNLIDGIFARNGQPQRKFEHEFLRIFRDKLWKSRCPLNALLR